MPRRHHINPPLNVYRKIALSFIVLTIILLGVIFYFTLTYAYITISPKPSDVSTDFNFIIVEDTKAVKTDQGIFLGKIVSQTLEDEKVFPATGLKTLAGDTVGTVDIVNNLNKSQTLVATTRLLTTDGILYRLKNKVSVPAHGSINTTVYPDDSTKPLALAGTKFTIPGLSPSLQQSVYAQATADFKAVGAQVKVVSQDDLDKAVTAYTDELAQQAASGLDQNSAKILSKQVISKEFSQKVGDQADQFKLKLKVLVSGVSFDANQVTDFAKNTIQAVVPSDKQLVSDSSDKLIYEISKLDIVNRVVQIKSNIKGVTLISENSSALDRNKLMKLSVDDLKNYLQTIDGVDHAELTFFPSWLKKMPSFSDHIIIKIIK